MVPAMVGRRFALLAWDVTADQEEPWRRFLQELSGSRYEEYAESRRRLGISAESVWLAPKRAGGGVAIIFLEVEDPEHALRGLVAADATFDSWYGTQMRKLFGCDFARLPRVVDVESLFAWRDTSGERGQESPEGS